MSATFKPELENTSGNCSFTKLTYTQANRTSSNEDTDLDADDWDFNDQKQLTPKPTPTKSKSKSLKRLKKKTSKLFLKYCNEFYIS